MTTLKERLENKLGGRYCNGNCELYHCANVKKFFHQELLALAEEIKARETDGGEDWHNGFDNAVRQITAVIRSKADELV